MNFSVCTSMPAARKEAIAQSTALAISGEPLMRPPISSVSLRRFSSRGDSPITRGVILAAACAQEEASVVEQPAAPWIACVGWRGSVATGGSWAKREEATKQRSNDVKERKRLGIQKVPLDIDLVTGKL